MSRLICSGSSSLVKMVLQVRSTQFKCQHDVISGREEILVCKSALPCRSGRYSGRGLCTVQAHRANYNFQPEHTAPGICRVNGHASVRLCRLQFEAPLTEASAG